MGTLSKWSLSKEEQERFISVLTDELPPLRAKLGISQGEIAYLIGISRQSYSLIECKKKKMSWSVFLALVLFFDYNLATHQMIRSIHAFPEEMVERFNGDSALSMPSTSSIFGRQTAEIEKMFQSLDEQGIHSLKTVLMIEYARCSNLPGDSVIKAFDGASFDVSGVESKIRTVQAIKCIQEKDDGHK